MRERESERERGGGEEKKESEKQRTVLLVSLGSQRARLASVDCEFVIVSCSEEEETRWND